MFIPDFPYDSTITIRSLLTHRSGIPDYTYAFDKIANKKAPLSSQQVVEMFAKYKPKKYFNANQNYSYNNSNYVVLANIVERITGLSFRKYAQKNLFEPCGMKNSFIYDPENPEQVAHAARGYNSAKSSKSYPFDFLDGAVGDKGVYSTVEDLYLWDMALNSEKLVKLSSLENDAFQPAHTFKAPTTRNYGFGWRLQLLDDGSWLTYHTGWWHGFKNYYMHNRKDNSSIICLGNIANNSLSKIKIAQSILYPEKAWYFMDGMNYTHQIE
jgi:CubicO group peptidase (beta-lactamase class C family)